jgi:hypothetical protein
VKLVEVRGAVGPAPHRLTVDQGRRRLEGAHGADDARITIAPIVAAAREQAHAIASAAGHQAVAVLLDLVHPLGAGPGPVRCGGKAGLNEAAGRPALDTGTHKHGR